MEPENWHKDTGETGMLSESIKKLVQYGIETNGYVKAKTGDKTANGDWYKSVYMPIQKRRIPLLKTDREDVRK